MQGVRPDTGGRRVRGPLFSRVVAVLVVSVGLAVPASLSPLHALAAIKATTKPTTKVVRYHGVSLVVPATWPVYDLKARPGTCVRFNRHAVYLGTPGAQQNCPAHSVGRTEAILVAPMTAATARAGTSSAAALPPVTKPGAQATNGSVAEVALPADAVLVTATWGRQPSVVARALGRRSLPGAGALATGDGATSPGAASSAGKSAADPVAATTAPATGQPTIARLALAQLATSRPATTGRTTFTGLGFDDCSLPSEALMAAWHASPYRGVGVYIGGTNMSCSQPNLSPDWISREVASGWHLAPIYVGLQAPNNLCSCAGIAPSQASAQGRAAASDAVTQARSVGIGSGSPIYFDMEAYPDYQANTNAVMAFLAAWTAQLHAQGYRSGVYSSDGSGIADLVARYGTGYREPDDLWVADWNGARTTTDPYVPAGDWPDHHRLHQYNGGEIDTFGGFTLNVDGDYIDGDTAGSAPTTTPPPTPKVAPAPSVSVAAGSGGTNHLRASWMGKSGITGWRALGGDAPATLVQVGGSTRGGTRAAISVLSQLSLFAVQALGSGGRVLGTSAVTATPAHLAIFSDTIAVSHAGVGVVPVGCYLPAPCPLTVQVVAGGRVAARTKVTTVEPGSVRLISFGLKAAGRRLLARAYDHFVLATITVSDPSGAQAGRTVVLRAFRTHGAGPARTLTPAPGFRLLGATDFVSRGAGAIAAACTKPAPCRARATLTAHGKVIATAGQTLGAQAAGYLQFHLTAAGVAMLARAPGNQLATGVRVVDGTDAATGSIALVALES